MDSHKIRISAVKYANTYPFIYGMAKTGFDKKIILETDHPAECAAKLIRGSVDIGLIPVAALSMMKEYYIITDYCLGAYGKVKTVMLMSNCPFEKIKSINLDYRSLSSINLVKILAKNAWKKEFRWNNTSEGFDFINIPENDAVVLIGDQCFEYKNRYNFSIDLAEEWNKFTGLPFTFACWTANRKLDEKFIKDFNDALGAGVKDIPAVIDRYGKTGIIRGKELKIYLTQNISYDLNYSKRKAIDLFLQLMKEL
jgi:chorismate dehydratase